MWFLFTRVLFCCSFFLSLSTHISVFCFLVCFSNKIDAYMERLQILFAKADQICYIWIKISVIWWKKQTYKNRFSIQEYLEFLVHCQSILPAMFHAHENCFQSISFGFGFLKHKRLYIFLYISIYFLFKPKNQLK